MGYTRPVEASEGEARIRAIKRMLWIILVLNLAVALAKLAWGLVTGSSAMQADGFHSMFDGASNVVGLVGMALAGRPVDRDHPYGHSKYETYASAIIGVMLVFAAWRIGSQAFMKLIGNAPPPTVDWISFAVMFGTLIINLGVTTWEHRVGKRLRSEILVADASHTMSDAFVSIGVIISLVLVLIGEKFGIPILLKADPVVALLVTVAIVYTAWGVFKQANETLSDHYRIEPAEICGVACDVDGVLGCHQVRTRGSEAEVYVDLHVQVDPSRTVADGHAIAEKVERAITDGFPQVADVIAHLEPMDSYQAEKTAREVDAGLT